MPFKNKEPSQVETDCRSTAEKGRREKGPIYSTQFGGRLQIIQLMKNEEFEVKLLIKQNTQMAIKLQAYRRDNQELTLKNENLNIWVQNLSEVFASLGGAWKIITDNEEALYTLMRKKSDNNAKQMVSKYISHFKAFDEIITNLGDKITNQGHSDSATTDAKTRLTSFVNNYNLFFLEFVQTFFTFNEECISITSQQLKEPNMTAQMRQIANQSLQSRQKLKDFQEYINKMSQNHKLYQTYNQHQLLDGIILQKDKEIEQLKDRTLKQARRIAYMTDYNTQNVNFVLENESHFQCFCGGAPLKYYHQVWEEHLKQQSTNLTKKQSEHHMMDESEEAIKEKMKQMRELQLEKQVLLQRNVQLLAKAEKIKVQNKVSDEAILQSPLYLHLKGQFKDLMDYTNDLSMRLNKTHEFLSEIEKVRQEEIEQIKKKYQKSGSSSHRHHSQHIIPNTDYSFLNKFKEKVQTFCLDIKNQYSSIQKSLKEKEQNFKQNKQSLKFLKKQNQDLNRRLGELQEKQLKSVENLEFRHQKFNQLQKAIKEVFKNVTHTPEIESTKRGWEEFAEYTKTRDKKIKAMEDMIKKKEKQIVQKQKVQEVMKNSMAETEDIYEKYKQKLNAFEQFMKNIEKEITTLSEQNYKIKMQSQQEKNILNIRLKNELEVKGKLEDRVKTYEKIQEEVKASKNLQLDLQKKLIQFQAAEREKINTMRLDLREKQRNLQQLNETLAEKQKITEKLLQDKEKKNLQMSKLQVKMSSNSEFDMLKAELEDYKSKIMCRCGAQREREIVLKTCPHIFCKKCIDDTTANRNRKCPMCGIRFTKTDIHEISWT